ncbi:MAG: hypothetical protein ACP6KW_09460 [Candidatus Thorarchaeota archaeon]
MSDEATNIIEEYLLLVREKLPKSIAEDVITELRTYMLEAAAETGRGEVTVESAKKVVARFGAPGEVADEYRYSMFPESLEEQPLPASGSRPDTSVVQGESTVEETSTQTPEGMPGKEHRLTDPTYTYTGALAKICALIALTAVLVGLLSIIQGPVWASLLASTIMLMQVVTLMLYFVIRLIRLSQQGVRLWDKANESWSGLQRALSLPEGISDETSNRVAYVDAVGSAVGIAVYLLITAAEGMRTFYFILISVPALAAFLTKIVCARDVLRRRDPASFVKPQFAATFLALMTINASLVWVEMLMSWQYFQAFNVTIAPLVLTLYALVMGPVFLYQLVTRAQDLWWDTQDTFEDETHKAFRERQERALRRLGGTVVKTLTYVLGGLFVLGLVIIVTGEVGWIRNTIPLERTLAVGLVLILLASPAFALYYLYRRYFIISRGSDRPVGKRTRAETVIDLVLTIFFQSIFIAVIFTLFDPVHIGFLTLQLATNLGVEGAMMFVICLTCSFFILTAGLVLRFVSDIVRLANRGYRTSMTLHSISSMILVVGLSIVVSGGWVYADALNFELDFQVLAVSILVIMVLSFQVGLTQQQLATQESQTDNAKVDAPPRQVEDWARNT